MWDTGIEFGTVGVGRGGHRLEITTYRADAYDQVSRNPEVGSATRLEDDLVRRDFTVNAMAVRLTPAGPGEFLDPLGGLAALRDRVLRTPADPARCPSPTTRCGCCGPPASSPQLGFTVAPRVREAMRRDGRRSWPDQPPSGWRAELAKLLLGADPRAPARPAGARPGWPSVVLPELPRLRLAIDEHHRHKDVYEHTLTVLRQAIALEDDGPGPGAALGRAAARHRQARAPAGSSPAAG